MADVSPTAPKQQQGCLWRLTKVAVAAFMSLVIAGMTGWCSLFLLCSPIPGEMVRKILAIGFALAVLLAFIILKKRWRTTIGFFVAFGVLVTWYYMIPPSNNRDWAPEVARMPTATINGNLVTITNIRNFEYRTVNDFT